MPASLTHICKLDREGVKSVTFPQVSVRLPRLRVNLKMVRFCNEFYRISKLVNDEDCQVRIDLFKDQFSFSSDVQLFFVCLFNQMNSEDKDRVSV